MPYNVTNDSSLAFVQVNLTGQLTHAENTSLVGELTKLSTSDTTSLLMTFVDFEGLSFGAIDADTREGCEELNRFNRLAVVADVGAQEAIATMVQPFSSAEVQFFDPTHAQEALNWLSK